MQIERFEYNLYLTFIASVIILNVLQLLGKFVLPEIVSWIIFSLLLVLAWRIWTVGHAKDPSKPYVYISVLIWIIAAVFTAPFGIDKIQFLELINVRIIVSVLLGLTWFWIYKKYFL